MKLSEAILRGMERFPRKAIGTSAIPDERAACALGCAAWALYGNAFAAIDGHHGEVAFLRFREEFGLQIADANDEGLLREEIAGMLMAIGE